MNAVVTMGESHLAVIIPTMEPFPDRRWQNMIGGLDSDGNPLPMSFEVLQSVAQDWETLVAESTPSGVSNLLATARSLFAYSWFRYEFMVVGCLIALQALEAVFRQVLYPKVSENIPLKKLVEKAEKDGFINSETADLIATGADLRNSMSHPLDQSVFTPGMAAGVLRNIHHLISQLVVGRTSNSSEPEDCGSAGPK